MKITRRIAPDPSPDPIWPGFAMLNYNGTPGDDIFTGGPDRDLAQGFGGNDQLSGGGGDDSLGGGDDNDVLKGEGGDDTLYDGNGNDLLEGGEGNDWLAGADGVDLLYGGAGDDEVRVSPGFNLSGEVADGGDGFDTLVFFGEQGSAIELSLANPSVDQIVLGITIRNLERLSLNGSNGGDHVTGGQYNDRIYGGSGDDVLNGGDGNDELRGETGFDQLLGGAGDDTIYGESDQLIDGGDGVDLVVLNYPVNTAGSPTFILDVSNPFNDQILDNGTMRNVERVRINCNNVLNDVTGGAYDDQVVGGSLDDILRGGGGNDVLGGGAGGIDQLYGGGGDDYLHSYETTDTAGDSVLDGGDGFDLLELSIQSYTGNTTLDLADTVGRVRNIEQIRFYGGSGVNIITGGNADDMIRSGNSADQLNGFGGNDNISSGGGDDVVHGGAGDDFVDAGDGANMLYGEDGNDSLRSNGSASNFMDGGIGNDQLIGGFAADTLIGGEGNDRLDGGEGADLMTGGVGNDLYVIDNVGDVANELAGEGIDEVLSFLASYTLGDVFENLSGNNLSTATGQQLVGNAIANIVTGTAGSDFIDGAAGADTMRGFDGNDTYIVDNVGDVVTGEWEGYEFGFDAVYTFVSYALAADVEVEWFTTYSNAATTAVNLTGNAFGQYLIGNNGGNILDGRGGADFMQGFAGDDTFYVDHGNDAPVEVAGQGFDAVYANISFGLANGTEIEWLSATSIAGTQAINLLGNEIGQYLIGNNGSNALDGAGGADIMIGYAGDDTYYVDQAGDSVLEATGGGFDALFTTSSFTLATGSEVEWLTAASVAATTAINLGGNEFVNYVLGNNGANMIDGGAGSDILYGYGGADMFQFTTALGAGNVDTVTDFVAGTDKIALDDAIFTHIGALGALNANAFVTGAAAADADDRIVYNSATGQLFYDADGNGAGAAVLFATLQGNPALAASDFQVI